MTDSGGYQIFSMGHGSVADEVKGRRGTENRPDFGASSVSDKGRVGAYTKPCLRHVALLLRPRVHGRTNGGRRRWYSQETGQRVYLEYNVN